MGLKQKINKIRRMTVAEMSFRLKEQIRIRYEQLNAEKELQKYSAEEFNFFTDPQHLALFRENNTEALLDDPRFMRRLSEPFTEERRKLFGELYPQELENSVNRAEAFLKHEFTYLGRSMQLPDPIPWHCDPVSLTPYPAGFYRDINIFTNKNVGDVKHVWEINRLQWLTELAKAYYLTKDERYGIKVESTVADWYKNNPFKRGIAWASALEVGVRSMALIWTLQFYRFGPNPNPQTVKTILRILYQSAAYLHHNLSIYFSPYNHLIGETAGLFAIAWLFPGMRGMDSFAEKSRTILENQITKQFHRDGGLVEQATFYHHFTLGFYLQYGALLKLNGKDLSGSVSATVRKALYFAQTLTKPDGQLPWIGDIDDARSICFANPTSWDFRSFQAIGAALFKDGTLKAAAQKYHEDAFWILPDACRDSFAKLKTEPAEDGVYHFKESGYTVIHSQSDYALLDHGPIAQGVFEDATPSAAHGHADLLHLELMVGGKSFLVDPGFSNYRGEFDWHCYFRSTAAHNTIEVNGASQAVQGKILQWSHAPRFKVLAQYNKTGVSGVLAEHYGYHRLDALLTHRRGLYQIDRSFFLVIDNLFAQQKTQQAISFALNQHFAPNIEVRLNTEQNRVTADAEGVRLNCHYLIAAESGITLHYKKGENGPDGGWVSPTYLKRAPAPLVQIAGQQRLPVTLMAVYYRENETRPIRIEGQWPAYKIAVGSHEFELTVRDDQTILRSPDGLLLEQPNI